MSYYRIYPNRNNTIFRYLSYSNNTLNGYGFENINCGANPVMELMDGKGESKLLFGFQLSDNLKSKLNKFPFKANLQLWDAGTLFEPAIKLKNISLEQFDDNFSEGDGYAFLDKEVKTGFSNWVNASSTTLWNNVIFNPVTSYQMNRINEDYNFDVTTSLSTFLSKNLPADNLYNLSLKINDRENDSLNIYRKFIHSSYTKTVFKPYLEFFIDDLIIDSSNSFYANESNKIYLINKTGKPFTNNPIAQVTINNVTTQITSTQINNLSPVYFVEITPTVFSTPSKKEICSIIWSIDNIDIQKQLIEIKNPNSLIDEYNYNQLFFYPITPSTHNIIRQGDVLPFTIVSEIRGKGSIMIDTYEYKICSMDGFEMCPWTQASLYKNQIFFNVNTDYYFPEQSYEVFVRNKTEYFTITSNLTYKFFLRMNDKSHLRELSASPYYSREQFFSK